MRGAVLVTSLVLLALSPARPAFALTLAIDTSNLVASTEGNGVPPADADQVLPGSLPASGSLSASESDSVSSLVFDLTHDDFEFVFDQILSASLPSSTGAGNHIAFRTDVAAAYTLNASFSSTSSFAAGLTMAVSLLDGETGPLAVPLLRSIQISVQTPGESFVLGRTGGDDLNMLDGSPTGVLQAGHLYILAFSFSRQATAPAGSPAARATGTLSLALVPEPSLTLLSALGAAALALARGRRP